MAVDEERYKLSFTNATIVMYHGTIERPFDVPVVVDDALETEVTVQRVNSEPLTVEDQMLAYEIAKRFCHSIFRRMRSMSKTDKVWFYNGSATWSFREACR